MKDDNFYYDYLGQNALSSSNVKLLLQSPKTYNYVTKYGSKQTSALRDGWLFHTAILEPDKYQQLEFVDVQSKATNKYKEAKEKNPNIFTAKEKSEAERLIDAFYKNEYALQMITDCEFEVPAIGLIENQPFRAKADVLCDNKIVDIKTTNDIGGFKYSVKKYHYDVQVFIYCELFNIDYTNFKFLVIDKKSLDIGIFDVSEETYINGKNKTYQAIETYKEFFIDGADIDSYCIRGIV